MKPLAIKPVRWQKFEKFLLANGCVYDRQKGSHRVYKKPDLIRPIILPAHTKDIPVMVILNNLRTLGISRDEYLDYIEANKRKR